MARKMILRTVGLWDRLYKSSSNLLQKIVVFEKMKNLFKFVILL